MKTQNELCRDLEEMLELDANTLTGSEQLSEINWDSLAVVMFIALADKDYGVAISASDLREAKTVAGLYALVSK